jgi:hypothetical protein
MVFSSFRIWEAIDTKGDANSADHRLAKIAVQEFTEKIWMEEILSCIFDKINYNFISVEDLG